MLNKELPVRNVGCCPHGAELKIEEQQMELTPNGSLMELNTALPLRKVGCCLHRLTMEVDSTAGVLYLEVSNVVEPQDGELAVHWYPKSACNETSIVSPEPVQCTQGQVLMLLGAISTDIMFAPGLMQGAQMVEPTL